MAELADDDISADIRNSIAELGTGSEMQPLGAAEIGPADDAPDMSNRAAPEPRDERVRDESGRFAPKALDDKQAKEVQTPQITAPEPGSESPQPGDIAIPRSLSPEAKAQFKDWPELARNEFLRREADTARGVEKLQQELRSATDRYQPLEAVIAPHRDKWAVRGMSDGQAIGALVAAQNVLDTNAPYGIAMLAKSYGVDLGQLAAQLQGQGIATPAQADPQYQQLQTKISTLEQRLQAQDQASHSQRLTETLSAIDTFARDPANLYFDNVREPMAKLMESGAAETLQQAYQMACWSNETIRNLMLAAQQRGPQADEEARRRQHAQAAREAGGSLTGSAGPGESRAATVDPSASIDDDIRNAMKQLQGRV